jgi:hypothetical protein
MDPWWVGRGLVKIKESILTHNHDFHKSKEQQIKEPTLSCEFHVNFFEETLY